MTRLVSIPSLGVDFDTSKPALEAIIEAVETGQRVRNEVLKSFVKVEDLVDLGLLRLATQGKSLMQFGPSYVVPNFLNSWVNLTPAEYNPAGYYKDAFGRVYLRGMISSGTVNAAAFTLPAGYRPEWRILCAAVSNFALGRVDVFANGDVMPVSPSNNAWVSLDGVSFVAVQ